MKIICIRCKKTIGEQEPFDDNSEINAKCPRCIEAEKEEALRKEQMNRPMRGREIIFDNGLKGIISLAGVDTPELSFWEVDVGGKVFFCFQTLRVEEYLERMNDKEVDVTVFHSISMKLPPKRGRGRKKKEDPQPEVKQEEEKPLHYNCTIRVPKKYVMSFFDDKVERLKNISKIMAEAAIKEEESNKPNKVSSKLPMS